MGLLRSGAVIPACPWRSRRNEKAAIIFSNYSIPTGHFNLIDPRSKRTPYHSMPFLAVKMKSTEPEDAKEGTLSFMEKRGSLFGSECSLSLWLSGPYEEGLYGICRWEI